MGFARLRLAARALRALAAPESPGVAVAVDQVDALRVDLRVAQPGLERGAIEVHGAAGDEEVGREEVEERDVALGLAPAVAPGREPLGEPRRKQAQELRPGPQRRADREAG